MKPVFFSMVCVLFSFGCGWEQNGFEDSQGGQCGELTYEGQCSGGTVEWCEDGVADSINCTAQGDVCGWDEQDGFYDCVPEGSSQDPYPNQDPEPENNPQMQFSCGCGEIVLEVRFQLASDGSIRGVLGDVTPEEVRKVKFFMDETDIADSPKSDYDLDANSARMALPGCSASGNLFLKLESEDLVWSDLSPEGGQWEVIGAQSDGDYLVANCGDCGC